MQHFADKSSTFAVFTRIDSRPPVRCMAAHPHTSQPTRHARSARHLATRGAQEVDGLSSFEGGDLHPAERVIVKAVRGTLQADHLRGLRSRCERPAMSGQVARNVTVPLGLQVMLCVCMLRALTACVYRVPHWAGPC